MAIVDEMYSERESLETIIEWNTAAILYARGRDWCPVTDWSAIIRSDLANIARESGRDVDVFVFLTGSGSRDGLGLAWGIGTTCSSDKGQRINMNKYGPAGEFKGRDAYTAEVSQNSLGFIQQNEFLHSQTIAHEIGHNLGMFHDFDDNSATREPRVLNGRQCWGYMDYEDGTHLGDHTNQWSHCSVSDFTRYVNRQNSFCLQSLGDGGGGGGNCVDKSGSCNWYANNNYCPAYPDWMLENCAKSCALCGGNFKLSTWKEGSVMLPQSDALLFSSTQVPLASTRTNFATGTPTITTARVTPIGCRRTAGGLATSADSCIRPSRNFIVKNYNV